MDRQAARVPRSTVAKGVVAAGVAIVIAASGLVACGGSGRASSETPTQTATATAAMTSTAATTSASTPVPPAPAVVDPQVVAFCDFQHGVDLGDHTCTFGGPDTGCEHYGGTLLTATTCRITFDAIVGRNAELAREAAALSTRAAIYGTPTPFYCEQGTCYPGTNPTPTAAPVLHWEWVYQVRMCKTGAYLVPCNGAPLPDACFVYGPLTDLCDTGVALPSGYKYMQPLPPPPPGVPSNSSAAIRFTSDDAFFTAGQELGCLHDQPAYTRPYPGNVCYYSGGE